MSVDGIARVIEDARRAREIIRRVFERLDRGEAVSDQEKAAARAAGEWLRRKGLPT